MYMALVQFTPPKLKHLPYCYHSQKVKIQDNGVYCNIYLSLSLSHTHTIFKTPLALTDGVDTHNHASAFSPSHARTCVYVSIHSVIQFKSCIFSELSTGVLQLQAPHGSRTDSRCTDFLSWTARNANLNSNFPRLEVPTVHAKSEELLHSAFSWTVATLQ